MQALAASGEQGLMQLMMTTHAGMTTDEFSEIVRQWAATAQHPRFHRPYIECVYQPMVELLAYLRTNGFKTYIVSGGGVEFMRPWAEKVYGIPPEQVVGSSIKTKLEMRDGKPVLIRLPEVDFIDDRDGKPAGIEKFIGRRPIAAFGNSDGDLSPLCPSPSRVDPIDEPLQYPAPHLILADLVLNAVVEVRIVVDLDHRDRFARLLHVHAVEPAADRAGGA